MRAFVALPCPPRLRAAIAEALATWRGTDAAVRWTDPDHMHLTLKFLGDDADSARLDPLGKGLRQAARTTAPLVVRPGETGAFPHWGRPRVLWMGFEADERMADLARGVEAGSREAGFPSEERPFTPHLTLGRVKRPRGVESIVGEVRGWRADTGAETLEEMVLYRSELNPDGARHVPLARYRLGEGETR